MGKTKSEAKDEVEFDYSIENRGPLKGKTHILVVQFPDECDEECFLISLKAYLKAQSENMRRQDSKALDN